MHTSRQAPGGQKPWLFHLCPLTQQPVADRKAAGRRADLKDVRLITLVMGIGMITATKNGAEEYVEKQKQVDSNSVKVNTYVREKD